MARDRQKKKNILGLNSYFDYSLLFLTIFLICFGFVMIYSASSYLGQRSAEYNNDAAFFLKKQMKAAVLGLFCMLVAIKFNYKWFMKFTIFNVPLLYYIYVFCLILQAYVLVFGEEINGQKRWIKIGGTSLQPSDITKCAVILFVAHLIYKAPRKLDKFLGFFVIFMLNVPVLGLIAKANLSTAIVVAAIVCGMCFVASRKRGYYFIFLGAVCAVGVAYLKFSSGYRNDRFQIWLNIDTHEKGYQIRQGLYAIASGGLTGSGLGESMQKLGYIPEAQNDMIFTVICEELGILGAIVTMMLFVFMLYRIYIITLNAPDLFGSMICVGVMIHIAVQVVLNVAVVTNSIPSTGVAMPFISYGGTSLLIIMAELGMVLSVSNQIRHER